MNSPAKQDTLWGLLAKSEAYIKHYYNYQQAEKEKKDAARKRKFENVEATHAKVLKAKAVHARAKLAVEKAQMAVIEAELE